MLIYKTYFEKGINVRNCSSFKCKWLTVVRFFNAWEAAKTIEEKRATLEIKKGRGAKSKLESVASILPNLVKENSRNLNVILDILEKNNNIKICKLTLQNFLKINRL